MKLSKTFVDDVRGLILSARTTAARGVDLVQVYTNFEIGRRIVQQEQKGHRRAKYGEEVVEALSGRLTMEFGSGFSRSNLEYMRRFFLHYQDRTPTSQSPTGKLESPTKSQTLSGKSENRGKVHDELSADKKTQTLSARSSVDQKGQSPTGQFAPVSPCPFTLSWSHYVYLLGIKNPDERDFYEIEAAAQDWTVRELRRQFDSSLYERLALSRNKDGIRKLAKEGQLVAGPQDILKEPLVLEFLGLDERREYSESDLETAIIDQIEHFLLELGKGFLFESRQRRFTFDGEHYFVDLVFYNRLLRCYVLIDLKLGKLTHQDLGQMQMYVNTFDQQLKLPDESPTIGIILCKQKNKAMVRITLPKGANIHAHEYQLYLPSKQALRRKLIEWAGEREVSDD